MFVCHGNICRSPMAEFIMKSIISKKGMEKDFFISSSATSTEEILGNIGNPIYPPAKEELKKHGILCDDKRAVQLKQSDYDKYDLFIGMDSMNIRNMRHILNNDPKNKIHKLMDYTQHKGDVADPWYSGNFTVAYNDIYDGCKSLLDFLSD
jgi:protein-tyrosine phosphatase